MHLFREIKKFLADPASNHAFAKTLKKRNQGFLSGVNLEVCSVISLVRVSQLDGSLCVECLGNLKKNARIGFFNTTFEIYNGVDHVIKEKAELLIKKGFNVTIFSLFKTSLDVEGCRVVSLTEYTGWGMFNKIFFLVASLLPPSFVNRPIIEQLKTVDFIVSQPGIVGLLSVKSGVPAVLEDHGLSPPDLFKKDFITLYRIKFATLLNRISLKKAHRVHSISNFVADTLKKEEGVESHIKTYEVDKSKYNKIPETKNVNRIKKKYGIGDKAILMVGRVVEYKQQMKLIELFKKYKLPDMGAQLIIAGNFNEGSHYAKRTRNLAQKVKGVKALGVVPEEDMPLLYKACKIYATMTLWEGWDIPLDMAHACGKPCVAYDIGAHSEVIPHSHLIPKNDEDSFMKRLTSQLEKTRT